MPALHAVGASERAPQRRSGLNTKDVGRTDPVAFLVCYSSTVEDHARERAAYLPQTFYETIFRVCRHEESFPILGRIASLRYKSPTLLVGCDELPQLVDELERLPDEGGGGCDFLAAANEAIARPCSLTISGDMCRGLRTQQSR